MRDEVCPLSDVVEAYSVNNYTKKCSDANDSHNIPASVPPAPSYSQEIHKRKTFFRPFEIDGSDSNDSRPPCIITTSREQFMNTELNANTSNSGSTNFLAFQNNDADDCPRSSHASIHQIYSMHQSSPTDQTSASSLGDSNTNHITEEECCCSRRSEETSCTNMHADCMTLCHTGVHIPFKHQDNPKTSDSISEKNTALQYEATKRNSRQHFGAVHESYQERIQDGNHVKLSNSNPRPKWIYDVPDVPNSETSVGVPDPDNIARLREDRHVSIDESCEDADIMDRTICNTTDVHEESSHVQANLLIGNETMSERIPQSPTYSSEYVSALADNSNDENSGDKVTMSDDDTDETLDDCDTDLSIEDGRKKPRRKRIIFSPEQLEELEDTFSMIMYPDSAMREEIASRMGILEVRIMVWFQNRRAKHRKQARSSEAQPSPTSTPPPTSAPPSASAVGQVTYPVETLFTRTGPNFPRMFPGSGTPMPFMPAHMFNIPMFAVRNPHPHPGNPMGISVLPGITPFTADGSYRPQMIGLSPFNTLHRMSPPGLHGGLSGRPISSLPASRDTHFKQDEDDSDNEAAEY